MQYGGEVHQVLSDAGLAPVLYQLIPMPGGFTQVSLLPNHLVANITEPNVSCQIHCPVSM